jgi:hypothetical protein
MYYYLSIGFPEKCYTPQEGAHSLENALEEADSSTTGPQTKSAVNFILSDPW